MRDYLKLLQYTDEHGVVKTDRTGTGTKSIFGYQMRFSLVNDQLPLVTTKKIHLKSVIHELLWFIRGETNIKSLNAVGVKIWDEWATTTRDVVNHYFTNELNRLARKATIERQAQEQHPIIQAFLNDRQYSFTSVIRTDFPADWTVHDGQIADGQQQWYGMSPDYDMKLLDALIEAGVAPASARDEVGELGPIYGRQWRAWEAIDYVEDKSDDAYLARHMKYFNDKTGENTVQSDLRDDISDEVYAHIHLKNYPSDRPYYMVPVHGAEMRARLQLKKNVEIYDQASEPIMITTTKKIDQLAWVINRLKTNPDCRRIIINCWNVGDLPKMALSPCHAMFQFWTRPLPLEQRLAHAVIGMKLTIPAFEDADSNLEAFLNQNDVPKFGLSCQLYQRSTDEVLGLPFNIASYAILTKMIAMVVNMVPDEFIWTGGDNHIYSNHSEQVETQLAREPFPLPRLLINRKVTDIEDFKYEDFELVGYESHAHIKAPVAV